MSIAKQKVGGKELAVMEGSGGRIGVVLLFAVGSCEVPVVRGAVDHRDLVLTRAEREEGRRMMTCCSRACGDRLVLGL